MPDRRSISTEGFHNMSQRLNQLVSYNGILILVSALVFCSGCGTGQVTKSDSKTSSDSVSTENSPTSETHSVAATKVTSAMSPAPSANKALGPDSGPDEVCLQFMKLIQSGNRVSAENLLTRTALATTTRAGLRLEPMGGPTSIYKIGEVRYATSKRKLAHVECSVIDSVDGENLEMQVVWQLHKRARGWRVSGVMLDLGPGQVKDLLSLENIQDVTKIQNLAGAELLDENRSSRQADASSQQNGAQLQ